MNAKLILACLAVAGLGGAYFFSDVFRSKVDQQITQLTEWTPENISEDPVGYLDFCERETRDASEALAQQEIALAQKRGEIERRRDESQQRVTLGDAAIDELIALYRAADAGGGWPVVYMDQEFDQSQLQRQITNFDRDLVRDGRVLEACASGLARVEERLAAVQDSRNTVADTLAEIASNRSLIEINEITDGTTEQFADMRDDVALVMSIADPTVEPGLLSIDDLVAQAESDVRAQEFESILSSRE